jgi:hypothetical protein
MLEIGSVALQNDLVVPSQKPKKALLFREIGESVGVGMLAMLAIITLPIVFTIVGILGAIIAVDRLPKLARNIGRMRGEFLSGEIAETKSDGDSKSSGS